MKFGKEAVRAAAFGAALVLAPNTGAQESVPLDPLDGAAIDACEADTAVQAPSGERAGESINGLRILTSITEHFGSQFDEKGELAPDIRHLEDLVTSVDGCTPQDFDAAERTATRIMEAPDAQFFRDTIAVLRQAYTDGDL
jgi:hypothetical protein